MTRKTATPARATRMVMEAPNAAPEKTRSPRRCLDDLVLAMVDDTGVSSALRRDGVDDLRGLLLERRGERSGAGVVGARLLALGRDDVAEEPLHVVGGLRVVVGRAGDQVRRQQQRVGTGLGGLAVD